MREALKSSLILVCLAVLLAAGCRPPRGQNYTVRAEVVELPSDANGHLFVLHHEAVDGFVTRDGKVEGMDSMTMPFLVAKNIPLTEIRPGDKVEVLLHVDWQAADRAVEIIGLRKHSPDLHLEFRAARPPGKP
ncbi:MAG TPA: copper-binding protein [Thermoanaerobaculia bacterium]|jgi:Cu/Ag efflux protein CusF|nr:copper-binding protein [Thermoanaerobaculia bacterium]